MTGRSSPSAIVVDTSVVISWFVDEAGSGPARAVLDAHRSGALTAHLLDLGVYEIGNVLVRALKWPAADVADQLDDLAVICGPPLVPAPSWHRDAAELAERHRLTFYDATFAAAGRALGVPVVSGDEQLIAAGLAESADSFVDRTGLGGA